MDKLDFLSFQNRREGVLIILSIFSVRSNQYEEKHNTIYFGIDMLHGNIAK